MDAATKIEINNLKADVGKHTEFIDGNGREGAKTRLSKLETANCEQAADINNLKNWRITINNFIVVQEAFFRDFKRIAVAVLIAVIMAILGFLWALLTHQVEIIFH